MKWRKTLWNSYCSKITFSDVYENHLNPFWNKVFLLLFSCSVVSDLFGTPWTAACQASLSFTISQSLLKVMSMVSMMLSNHLIFCCPLLLLLPSIFPSIRVFPNCIYVPMLYILTCFINNMIHLRKILWISSLHEVSKVLELQLDQSDGKDWCWSILPMNIQGWFPLGLASLISLQSKRLSRVFFSTMIQKHKFFGVQPSLWYNSHICT